MRLPKSGVAQIALASLFFGAMAVVARTLSSAVSFSQLAAIRFAVGVVGSVLLFAGRRRLPVLKSPGLLAMRGVFGGAAVLTYFLAIQTLGAAPATVLNYCSPIFAALWATVFLKERSSPLMRVGLAMATTGAALVTISTGAFAQPLHPAIGALAGIASGILGGAAMTAMKAAREGVDALSIFFVFCVVGFLMSLPLAIPTWAPLTAFQWFSALAVGGLALIAQLLFTSGMGHTSATVGSATTQLVPVVSWTLSVLFLPDPVSLLAVLGACLCVLGVVVGVVPRPPKDPHVGPGANRETETRRGPQGV